MSIVEDLPERVLSTLTARGQHPAYRWKLEAIIRNQANWGVWKNLEAWPIDQRERAVSARRSLTARFGNTPLIAGFEFATVSGEKQTHLAVKYDPGLVVEGEQEKWLERKRGKRDE